MRLPGSQTQFYRTPLRPAQILASLEPGHSVVRAARPCGRRVSRAVATLLSLATLALCTSAAQGQAAYTAKRAGDLQAGGGFSIANADYDHPTLRGGSIYASFDFKEHFGVEVDFHQVNAPSPSTIHERSYEIGGRYVRHYGIFNPYARLMYGRGVFNYQYNVANLAYNMADAGVGVDVNVTHRVNVRADYEYQQWFSFRGNLSNTETGTLSPQVFTIGAAYHFQ